MSLFERLLGRALAINEEEGEKIGVWAGIPILGLDGLSSAAYGQYRQVIHSLVEVSSYW